MKAINFLSAEQNYQRMVWRPLLAAVERASEFALWQLTASAAFMAVVISNVDSVSRYVPPKMIPWIFLLLGAGVVIGIVTWSLGNAITTSLKTLDELFEFLDAEGGKENTFFKNLKEGTDFRALIVEPFWGPLRWMLLRTQKNDNGEALLALKRLCKMTSWQFLLGTTNLVVLGITIGLLFIGLLWTMGCGNPVP